jgi:hypothetical protein
MVKQGLLWLSVGISTFAMILAIVGKGFWLAMGLLALGSGPLPHIYAINLILCGSFLLSLALLWRWPFVGMVVAWLDLCSILTGFSPWADRSATTFYHEFMWDHIFFIGANLGFIAVIYLRRIRATKSGSVETGLIT